MFERGAFVIANLAEPVERLWGYIVRLDEVGLVLRGMPVETFDDWMSQAASGEPTTLAASLVFVPMRRIEKIYLDETVGTVESYRERFERRVGQPVSQFLEPTGSVPPTS